MSKHWDMRVVCPTMKGEGPIYIAKRGAPNKRNK